MKLEKASLIPVDGEKADPIKFMFNPTQLSFSRKAEWKDKKGARGDDDVLSTTDFTGVVPYVLNIKKIIFDTYESSEDVLEQYLNRLKQSVTPTEHTNSSKGASGQSATKNRKRPPVYIFTWGELGKREKEGKLIEFRCVVTTLAYNLTMFLPNGIPVRAEVDLTLKEVDKERQNQSGTPQPTSKQREEGGR